MADLKQAACDAIDKYADDLSSLAKEIWEHPELNFEEFYCHDYLTKYLEDKGFHVDRKYKIDTAFRAVLGDKSQGPHVAVLCEYDALPEIGHACGHNLIAEVGVAAGLGIKAAFEKAGKPLGKVCACCVQSSLFFRDDSYSERSRASNRSRDFPQLCMSILCTLRKYQSNKFLMYVSESTNYFF